VTPLVDDPDFTLYAGDALDVLPTLPDHSVDAVVTSPPYLAARAEYDSPTADQFDEIFFELFRIVDGPALVNVGRLWRKHVEQLWWLDLVSSARRAGWELLDTLIWLKPNANPIQGELVTNAHEYVLVFGDPGLELNVDDVRTPYSEETIARYGRRYHANVGVKGIEQSRYRRPQPGSEHPDGARPTSVVVAYTGREKGNPFPAPMPLDLAEYLVKLAAPVGSTILDPFAGAGTTALAARRNGRKSVAIEKSVEYAQMAAVRLNQLPLETA
jgi:DNA modification methylase